MREPITETRRQQLGQAVHVLSAREDSVGIVRMVTYWRTLETPPVAVSVREAAALLDLCLPEAAWSTLQLLPDSGPHAPMRWQLLVRAAVMRGWRQQANDTVVKARMNLGPGEDFAATAAELGLHSPRPVEEAPTLRSPLPECIAAVESWLCQGDLERAKKLVTALMQVHQGDARVRALHGAAHGQLSLDPETAAALLDLWVPAESLITHPATDPAFPSLFRDQPDEDILLEDELEPTMVTAIPPSTDPAPLMPEHHDDTAVVRVISAHGDTDETETTDELTDSAFESFEAEDEDIVVLHTPTTSADEPQPEAAPAPSRAQEVVTAYDEAPNHFDVAHTLPWWRTLLAVWMVGLTLTFCVAVSLRLGLFEGG